MGSLTSNAQFNQHLRNRTRQPRRLVAFKPPLHFQQSTDHQSRPAHLPRFTRFQSPHHIHPRRLNLTIQTRQIAHQFKRRLFIGAQIFRIKPIPDGVFIAFWRPTAFKVTA
jgi:hypothetical protein